MSSDGALGTKPLGHFGGGLQKPKVAKIFIKSISALWVFGILLPHVTNPWSSNPQFVEVHRLDNSASEGPSS